MTTAMLKKQNKDLRTRLENLSAKREMSEIALNGEIDLLRKEIKLKDDQIKMLQQHIAGLEEKVAELTTVSSQKDAQIEKLKDIVSALVDQRDKFKSMLNKNSENSSKPPSSDGFRRAKAKSRRKKSSRKVGGQPGHPGHTVKPFKSPTKVIDKKPEKKCSCGGQVECEDEYIPKQIVDIRIVLDVIEERVHDGKCKRCGKIHKGRFSEGFVNPVQYGSNVKSLIAFLNEYGNVPIKKTKDIINGISNGNLHLSEGTIVNYQKKLAQRFQQPLEIIKQRLIQCNILGADETGCRVNGDLNWIQVFSNSQYTLFGLNRKRSALCADDMNILDLFTGILVHDHFKSYYKYDLITHAECNAHILRYLQAVIEIMKHPWAEEMAKLLCETHKLKKRYLDMGKRTIEKNKLNAISARYDKILADGKSQYEAAVKNKKNISYFNDERLLLKRLGEFKKEHLMFIENFDVPFDTNGQERDIRFVKNKFKVSGCFRSKEGAKNYAKIASLISTMKKQGINIYEAINDIYDGKDLIFDTDQINDSS